MSTSTPRAMPASAVFPAVAALSVPSVAVRLKLDPRDLRRLHSHPLLRRGTHRAHVRIYAVYFDTPDLDLWRAGIVLKLERCQRRWFQCVESSRGLALSSRRLDCSEWPVPAPTFDFDALRDPILAAHLGPGGLGARLKQVFVARHARRSCVIASAAGVAIDASIERGVIRAGDASEPVCELRLVVKTGSEWRAHQAALKLLETVPLVIEERSMAERGIALARHATGAPRKAPASPVAEPAMTCNAAFKALLGQCLEHGVANQRGMLEGADPEYLHQMRVALRRFRSVLGTFAPLLPAAALERPAAETRWLARALGVAREWDVFVDETLPPICKRYGDHTGIATMTRFARRLRSAADRRARRAVASARGQKLLLALAGWISAQTWREGLDETQRRGLELPVARYAQSVLDAGLKRVLKRGRHFRQLAPPELHRLRIAAKELRYAAEFFAPLHDRDRGRAYRAILTRLQDGLGGYNDAATVTRLAAHASRGLRSVAAHEARGIMLGWSAGMQAAATRNLTRIWKEFRAARPYWK